MKGTLSKIFAIGVMVGALTIALFHAPAPDLTIMPTAHAQSAMIGPYGWLPWLAANTAIDTATLSRSQMTGILIGTPTAAASYTTPSATVLCEMFPFVASQNVSNFGWDWVVKNTSAGAFTITVLAGAGVTVSGTATAAQSTVRHFKAVLTECRSGSTAAATIFSLTTGAF